METQMAPPKSDKLVNLRVRMPEALRKKLSAESNANERSLNSEIVYKLGRSFGAEGLEMAIMFESSEQRTKRVLEELVAKLVPVPEFYWLQFYWLQFYRQEPGDLGIDDLPLSGAQSPQATAEKALLGYFNNPNIAVVQRPHHARVVTHDRLTTVFTIMATGPKTVEKI